MKLFIWNNPYVVTYGSSCLYVLAEDEAAARKVAAERVIQARYGFSSDDAMTLPDLGAPTRIVEGPYAEVFHWEE